MWWDNAACIVTNQNSSISTVTSSQVSVFVLLIYVPRLGVYYFFVIDSVCLSVCQCVCLTVTLLQIDSSFSFFDGIEPIFGRHLSPYGTPQNVVLRLFDLGPLTPKIYSQKLLAITPHYHVANCGRTLSAAALPGKTRQSTELQGRSLLSWQQNLA